MANGFHAADYVIFIAVLVISAGIGIFFAWRDRKKQNAADFLLGGRKMGILPVSLSLMATLLNAVMVLGVPAEVYYNGAIYWMILFSNIIVYPVAAHAFLPVFHNLGLTSAYEYLEKRFNMLVRIVGCVVFMVQMTLSMSMGLFAPAIALQQVMDIDMLISILVIGIICTFYTAIGGLKAVMWTDTFQMLIIMAGFIAVLIKGTEEVGGFSVIWNKARDDGRLDVLDFDPNPLQRHTFWTLVVGGAITTLTVYGGNQAMVQRYLSMETVKKAQISMYLQLPAGVIVTSLFVYGGLVLYAKYPVDPVSDCTITLPDQLIPWLVMDVLGDFHGFPGLLLACIFSASLSTVSSGINAISLVCMADIIQPAHRRFKGRDIGEPKATIISKVIALLSGGMTIGLAFAADLFGDLILQVALSILALLSGGVTIGLAFAADLFGDLILQVALSIYGMIGGPLLGLFICAMFIPLVNEWGALVGILVGLCMTSWLTIGTILRMNDMRPPPPVCPSGIATNMTTLMTSSATMATTTAAVAGPVMEESLSGLDAFYSLSYLWYSAFAVSVTVIVAITVSCLTGGTRRKPVDGRLLSPLYHSMASFARVQAENRTEKYRPDVGVDIANGEGHTVGQNAEPMTEKPPVFTNGYRNEAFSSDLDNPIKL